MKRVLQFITVIVALVVRVTAHHLMTPTPTRSDQTARAIEKVFDKGYPVQINWRKPSENKPYPKWDQLKIQMGSRLVKQQRVYIMDGNKTDIAVLASTGVDNSTPRGTFHIKQTR